LQYEYVYRAIADYVDLYMNKEEEYEYSVPVGTLNNGTTKVRPHQIPSHFGVDPDPRIYASD
jgi:hypothetical protein